MINQERKKLRGAEIYRDEIKFFQEYGDEHLFTPAPDCMGQKWDKHFFIMNNQIPSLFCKKLIPLSEIVMTTDFSVSDEAQKLQIGIWNEGGEEW